MAAYLKYVQVLKGAFNALELTHVPREQNARADLLAKLASSGKGGRQRTVIQETLKAPRRFVEDNRVDVLQVYTTRGRPRNHCSLTQDTQRAPRISTYADALEGEQMQVCVLTKGDTWMGLSQWSPKRVRRSKETPQDTLWWMGCCSGTVSLTLS